MSTWRIAGLCVVGWVLTASGSLAGPRELLERAPVGYPQAEQRHIERAEVVDAATGAELRLSARPGGAVQVSLVWPDLDVSKVVQPGGDFHVRIAGRQDLLVLIRTGNRLRVTRGDKTAVVQLDRVDEDGLDAVQQILAGSHAMRAFRAVHRRLNQDSRESAPGISLDHVDVLLGILQGEPGVVDRRAPKPSGALISRAACRVERTCWSEYEVEVVNAWGDFAQCVDDVSYLPGMQEVCAFGWLLRTESAWFHFLGCSSFPMRVP